MVGGYGVARRKVKHDYNVATRIPKQHVPGEKPPTPKKTPRFVGPDSFRRAGGAMRGGTILAAGGLLSGAITRDAHLSRLKREQMSKSFSSTAKTLGVGAGVGVGGTIAGDAYLRKQAKDRAKLRNARDPQEVASRQRAIRASYKRNYGNDHVDDAQDVPDVFV